MSDKSDTARPRTYAIGDVHGRLDLLDQAIDMIDAHVGGAQFRVVFLGDYVDRGPDSCGVIERLMELQRRWPVVCLKGNHEEMMLQAVNQPEGGRLSRWLEYGGDQTVASYGLIPEEMAERAPREHLRWLASLPKTTGDRHRIYVHAGLMPNTPVHRQKEETCLWIRERFLTARAGDFEAHVVHGHTPIWDGKPDAAEPELLAHRTNLDTAAFATGVLAIAVFDSETPGGPVEVLKVRGEPNGALYRDADPEPARTAAAVPAAEEAAPSRMRRGLGGWFTPRSRGDGRR
jgi:serine/threonine protein phosphatase 1